MRGSVKWQVNQVFNSISAIGESRHEAKQQTNYSNPHELAQQTQIYSYKTLDTYRDVAKDLLSYAKENGYTKDIEKLTPDTVREYLNAKIEQGVSYNTIKTYSAAISKLSVALEAHNGQSYNFADATKEALETSKSETGIREQHRAFSNPQAVVDNIKNETYKTIAQFQLSSGLRISELNHIRSDQLVERDGRMYVSVEQGKGGKDRIVEVQDKEAFQSFKSLVNDNKQTSGRYSGKFIFSKSSYNNSIRDAAKQAGETTTGSHSFRWNFAQQKFQNLQVNQGYSSYSRQEALREVSESLGHNRAEITEHYLR